MPPPRPGVMEKLSFSRSLYTHLQTTKPKVAFYSKTRLSVSTVTGAGEVRESSLVPAWSGPETLAIGHACGPLGAAPWERPPAGGSACKTLECVPRRAALRGQFWEGSHRET